MRRVPAIFLACVILVVVWLPSYFVFPNLDTWQLVINTATTIVTFLLVALLQNSQRRFELAVQQKLDAIAGALADQAGGERASELREAVGIEERKSA